VHFDKTKDKFDVTARDALFNLAKPKEAGLYLSPLPKQEKLYSNLFPIESYAQHIYVAETEYRRRSELWRVFDELGVDVGVEWILRNERITSFHDLRQYPWSEICDQGTVECFDTEEWAHTHDPDVLREFVELLNHALEQKLVPAVWYNKRHRYYYFAPPPDLKPYRFYYQSLAKKTHRVVFQSYPKKDSPKEVSYYRHFAFSGAFVRYEDLWYLEITPTYRYTWNGYHWAWQGEELLKGIKRKEWNPAVFGQVIMWAEYLKQPGDMFRQSYPFLSFGSLLSFDFDAGIPDDAWLPNDDVDLTVNQLSLFGLSKG